MAPPTDIHSHSYGVIESLYILFLFIFIIFHCYISNRIPSSFFCF